MRVGSIIIATAEGSQHRQGSLNADDGTDVSANMGCSNTLANTSANMGCSNTVANTSANMGWSSLDGCWSLPT